MKKTRKQIWETRKKKLGSKLNEYIYSKVKAWRKRNVVKYNAHKKVNVAIKNGSLKKGKCFCGKTKVEAHHEDYTKPLEVTWLWKKHHVQIDIIRRRKES